MKKSELHFGTAIAPDIHDLSGNRAIALASVKTLGDLLDIWEKEPPSEVRMLRTTCSWLAVYFKKPIDQVTIDSVNDQRDGFRPFLESRTRPLAANSIRTYVNYLRILLKSASENGWKAHEVPEEWRGVLAAAAHRRCADIVKYLARIRKNPLNVTIEDADAWARMRAQQGLSYRRAKRKTTWFWRLLRDCGCTQQIPMCILREKNYGIPLQEFPQSLKTEVQQLLDWKTVEYLPERPKNGRHREVTSVRLQQIICALLGYAKNIRGESEIISLPQLVQKPIIDGFTTWCINKRKVKGQTLQRNLRLLNAAMHQHPSYKNLDYSWFKPALDRLPTEPKSVLRRRKAEKSLEYRVLESIPAKIHAERSSPKKKGADLAYIAMEELLISWLIPLPWRQRNVRECRVGGPRPNLFKGKIPPFMYIDKPEWVKQEEEKNPEAEFWQFHFNCEETKTGDKTGVEVHCVLPRPLIGPLEEYLNEFRPRLLLGSDAVTLFVNRAGKPMTLDQVTKAVADLTFRHGGRRVTPHLFRDIVAFAWLKAHPKDYLTLSKILWHADIKVTIDIYGSEYNESCGVVAMESWLEERESRSK